MKPGQAEDAGAFAAAIGAQFRPPADRALVRAVVALETWLALKPANLGRVATAYSVPKQTGLAAADEEVKAPPVKADGSMVLYEFFFPWLQPTSARKGYLRTNWLTSDWKYIWPYSSAWFLLYQLSGILNDKSAAFYYSG